MRVRTWARAILLLFVLAGTAWVTGCSRGQPRDRRPTVIVPDMEFQKKFKAQGYTELFEDHRMMRNPPVGTVARGTLKEDIAYFEGHVDSVMLAHNPRHITEELLYRGQDRFNIFCAPCHDRRGTGRGIVVGYGLVPPPSFHQENVREFADGHIFGVITNGVRSMEGYRAQIPTGDRWAIVAYIRALQRSQNALLADVPAEEREKLR